MNLLKYIQVKMNKYIPRFSKAVSKSLDTLLFICSIVIPKPAYIIICLVFILILHGFCNIILENIQIFSIEKYFLFVRDIHMDCRDPTLATLL